MVFSSAVFLFIFLPVVIILNMIIKKPYRNYLLLFASLLFYAWGEPVYILLMLFSILLNYSGAKKIQGSKSARSKKLTLGILVSLNLAMLFVFKYANFITYNIIRLTDIDMTPSSIFLPIGISFFTFQAMSYVIDVYKGTSKAENNIANTALYISFFPQLIAGPIIKHHDIAKQIVSRSITTDKMYTGIIRFIVGLAKKLLIANIMGYGADLVFSADPAGIGSYIAWSGAVFYTLQIYFDFSGYSDMAIGLGKIFGFDFKENFNYPYISSSMNEFWRRWHISLTNWFREYLYYPLGGNKKGRKRTYINLLIVFFCTGFWHGAEWTFILWGMTHGVFMLLEKANVIKIKKDKYTILGNIYTLLIVTVTFTIFRAPDISYALSFIKTMFSFSQKSIVLSHQLFSPTRSIVFITAVIASTPIFKSIANRLKTPVYTGLKSVFALLLLMFCILILAGESYNPFIYFRF